MLATVLLLAFALVAAVTDLLWSKIYNWNTYTGILVAVALSAACYVASMTNPSAASRLGKWLTEVPLTDSLAGLFLCGFVLIVCVVVFPGVGGGDVKLMAMFGAWLGTGKGIEAMLWTFVLAACFGIIGLVWKIGPLRTVSLVGRLLGSKMRIFGFTPPSEEEQKLLKPPVFIAPSALLAAVIVRFNLIT